MAHTKMHANKNAQHAKKYAPYFARTGLFAAISMASAIAVAQDTNSENSNPMEEVTVTGMRAALDKALDVKQNSNFVMDALSLEDINSTPAITIAEALVRMPGVSGVRDRGNESQAAIRGMGPRMVFSTLNGRELATSEPGRAVRYEQFPSEMISAVEVYKSQSADLTEGGIAGTINLKTLSPLNHSGPTYTVRAGLQYNDAGADLPNYDALGNRFSLSTVQSITDEFAIAVGYSAQTQKNAYASFQGWGMNNDATWQPALADGPAELDGDGTRGYVPWGAALELKGLTTEREGLIFTAEWAPSDDLSVKYDSLYTDVGLYEETPSNWYQGLGNWDGGQNGSYRDIELEGDYAAAATAVGIAEVRHVIAKYRQESSSISHGINVKYDGYENLQISADINYSHAERDGYWNAIWFDQYGQTIRYDFREGSEGVSAPDGGNVLTPTADGALTFPSWGPEEWNQANANEGNHLEDTMLGGNLDFKLAVDAGHLVGVDFGIRHAGREKENSPTSFVMTDPEQATAMDRLPEGFFTTYEVTEFPSTPLVYAESYGALAEAFYGGVDYSQAELRNGDYWLVEEVNNAAYVKLNFEGELAGFAYNANVGVRHAKASIDSTGYPGGGDTLQSVSNDYSHTLPSATINVDIHDDMVVRLSAARAISRPPVDEMRAGEFINLTTGAANGSAGNPYLEPYISDQIDISYEWYFASESLFAATLFYKDISNYVGIETIGTFQDENDPERSFTISGPVNGDGGYVKGVEFTFQMPFNFLPVEGFGVYSNLALADSNVMEFTPVNNPYTMAGLADYTATADLWYSNNRFDARLGYKATSDYTTGFTWNGAELNTIAPEASLGLSMSYTFTDNISARVQAWNLTNEPARLTRDNNNASLMRYDDYGRGYMADVTFTF